MLHSTGSRWLPWLPAAFGGLSLLVGLGLTEGVDAGLTLWLKQLPLPGWLALMTSLDRLANGLLLLLLPVIGWPLWQRRWRTTLLTGGLVGLALGLNTPLKLLIARPSLGPVIPPPLDWQRPLLLLIGEINDYFSYPSGHALTALLLTGLLLRRLPRRRPRPWPDWPVALALGPTLLIGCSRIVADRHYPTDILGGLLLGLSWLAVADRLLHRFDHPGASDDQAVQ